MKRFLRSSVLFLLCMALGLGVVFSGVTQAQITVSGPIIDGTTGGDFRGTYGECFFLLANPHIDRCEEEIGPFSYSEAPNRYRSPSQPGRNGCFNKINPDDPVSNFGGATNVCFGNPTAAPLNTLPVEFDEFSVDDFSVYRVDEDPDQAILGFMERDIAFAWTTIAGLNGGQYEFIPCEKTLLPLEPDRFTTFDSEFAEDTAVTEIEVNQTGSITLAYYFVNANNVCRELDYELFINNESNPRQSGVIGDIQSGKYMVFNITGLTGPTTIKLETTLVPNFDPAVVCAATGASIPGVNAHISGVFIDNCEPCVGRIGDFVWFDENKDGCQDPNEGIEGVTVCLYEDADCENNVPGNLVECQETLKNGSYLFDNLECGKDYEVEFNRPDSLVETDPNSCPDPGDPGTNDPTKDSDCVPNERVCVSLGVNGEVEDLTIDCGYVCPLTLEKKAKPDNIVCDSGTDGTEGFDDCVVDCRDTGTNGDFNDDKKCIAETVTYTITVTNPSDVDISEIVVADPRFDFTSDRFELAPGESETFEFPGECLDDAKPRDVVENTVMVTVDGKPCGEATATVTTDFECIDTGTDGRDTGTDGR